MGNAKTELRFLERELERLQDMGLDDISKYVAHCGRKTGVFKSNLNCCRYKLMPWTDRL